MTIEIIKYVDIKVYVEEAQTRQRTLVYGRRQIPIKDLSIYIEISKSILLSLNKRAVIEVD